MNRFDHSAAQDLCSDTAMSVLPVDAYLTMTPFASVIGEDARQYAQIFVRVFASFIASAHLAIQEFECVQSVLDGLTLFRPRFTAHHTTANRILRGGDFSVLLGGIHFKHRGEIRSLPVVLQCVGHKNLHRCNTIDRVERLSCLAHRGIRGVRLPPGFALERLFGKVAIQNCAEVDSKGPPFYVASAIFGYR